MHSRLTHIAAAAIFTSLLLWLTYKATHRSTSTSAIAENSQPDPHNLIKGMILGHEIINLTNSNIDVSRIHIEVIQSHSAPPLPLVQPFDITLPPSTSITIDLTNNTPQVDTSILPPPLKTNITIPNLPTSPPNASAFIFGLSTTQSRLLSTLPILSHFLTNTSAPLIAHLPPPLDNETHLPQEITNLASTLSITLGTIESHYEYLDRYFGLLRVLHANRLPTTQWYVLIDDDTFFPSLSSLLSTFAKYDPAEPWYIGALSEDFTQLMNTGYFGYGGGGIFLSHALVEELLPHYDECFMRRNTGDRMVGECIYRFTRTKFTWESRLHQVDLVGDHGGFYEAIRERPLSLHHWRAESRFGGGRGVDVWGMSRVAAVCGEGCLLGKFRVGEWLLTNGFSLVRYSDADVRRRVLGGGKWWEDFSMERTWGEVYAGTRNAHFEYSLGPIRNKDEGKISFRMESVLVEEDGKRVRQLYVRRDIEGSVMGVMEVTWTAV